VVAARRLALQLVVRHGKPMPAPYAMHPTLTHVFPTAVHMARVQSIGLGMPAAREHSLKALAEAVAADPNLFRQHGTIDNAIERLRGIRGIGPWTAHYIALRAMREMDAFPSTDIGLLRGMAGMDATCSSPACLEERAESWRPWRAYAAQHLWTSDASRSLHA
jgi:AraC family transcriptional regulator of adaptative response / DNA-3-methyladenine glycosylase II